MFGFSLRPNIMGRRVGMKSIQCTKYASIPVILWRKIKTLLFSPGGPTDLCRPGNNIEKAEKAIRMIAPKHIVMMIGTNDILRVSIPSMLTISTTSGHILYVNFVLARIIP